MVKSLFLLSFIAYIPFALSQNHFFITQNESVFDDSDLENIESGSSESDQDLEDEFESSGDENNFNEEDFETWEEGDEEEGEGDEENEEGIDDAESKADSEEIDEKDYEILSDRPGYELDDEGFEGEDELLKEEDGGSEEGDDSGLGDDAIPDEGDDSEKLLDDEALEQEFHLGDEGETSDESAEKDPELGEEGDTADEGIGLDEEGDTADEEMEGLDEGLTEESIKEQPAEPLLKEESFSGEALNLVSNIRYSAEKDQILIDCSELTFYKVKKNKETNQFILDISQARLVANLDWPYPLRDFNTQFGMIKADQKDPHTVRIVIQLKEGADFPQSTLTEKGNQIIVAYGEVINNQILSKEEESATLDPSAILPAKTLEDLYLGNFKFSGDPISFHVIDAPVKQVLRFISEESGLNMVIGEKVTGTVTLKLEDVPWDQALHTIFKVKSLGYTRDGNVITILPLSEIEERTKKLKEIADRQKSISPFETKVIPISYGKIGDIAGKVKDFSTPSSNLSTGGKIIVNPENNTFVVIDTPEAIKKIEMLVNYLDKPPKQVMVEAKIVEAAENFARNFGLKWDLSGNFPVTINASGLIELFSNIGGSYSTGSDGTTRISLSGLPVVGDISASLSLAEGDGYAQVISSPKVVVISGRQASITRDAPILIPTSTTTTNTPGGNTSTQQSQERESVSISLNVTPTVTTTGSVFLEVDVTRSDPGGREGAFKISRSAKTHILTKNGQTVVIGGIYEQDQVIDNQGIPFFRKIPFLNFFFNTRGINRSKTELLVFITPKLLDSHE